MSNIDFFQIGALKVFAELGQLIEEDESNQIKFMDLPTDIIQINISKYLLEDKQINKIFHNQEDNELKFILFGNNIELPYMNLNNRGNKIEVKNDELLKYVNYILKQKGINKVVKNISVEFHERQSNSKNCFSWIEKTINLLDKENNSIAWINEVSTFGIMNIRTTYLKLVIKQEDKDIVQTIKKENIINECYSIHNYISECIQNYYSD
jgi:tRNA U34 5-carboxymethylaminomethyl modifying GTPase MnmE/TrmE